MIPFDKVDIEVITGRIYTLQVSNFKTGATNDLTHPRTCSRVLRGPIREARARDGCGPSLVINSLVMNFVFSRPTSYIS
jgi:hypothetical protein